MAKLTVTTVDQRVFQHVERHRRGSPENPVSAEDLAAKFRALTASVLSTERQAAVQAHIDMIDTLNDSRQLVDLLDPEKHL
jgi:2-methylcitrate dehydratase PrpD